MEAATSGFRNTFEKLADGLREIGRLFPDDVNNLSKHGWFISQWHTPIASLHSVTAVFEREGVNEGHELMMKHFSAISDDIVEDLVRSHPERSKVIQRAFDAHKAKLYELSIPVLLSQADGIANEIFGVSVYTRRADKRKELEAVIDSMKLASLDQPLMKLLLADLPLTESTTSQDFDDSSLNRHSILHGLDLDYANELNSLRAISWIQFTSYFHEVSRRKP